MPDNNQLNSLQNPYGYSGHHSWESPSNIALVKYWGKKSGQIPMNPSLSITLNRSKTITKVAFTIKKEKGLNRKFLFDGNEKSGFEGKIDLFLNMLIKKYPFVDYLDLHIESHNTFPHSSGIASSASSMSSLALSMLSIIHELTAEKISTPDFLREASFFARQASGSASRSVYGNYVLWGESDKIPGSSDTFAVKIQKDIHPVFQDINDSILIVSREPKEISSTKGHEMMNVHPYADARYRQARRNLDLILEALKTGNIQNFISIVENEAMSLHALMMSSDPSYTLMKPETLEIINRIREVRMKENLFLCFTLDAGPNIHLLYPDSVKDKAERFINSELKKFCEDEMIIFDKAGNGPVKL